MSNNTTLMCTPSVNGYGISSAATHSQDFCSTAFRSNTSLLEKSYGIPYMTFRLSNKGSCEVEDCLTAYTDLFNGCQYNNDTIWGTAQTVTSCATYNYTIGNVTSPFLTPNKTSNASITPSPTGDANGKTTGLGSSDASMPKISVLLIFGVASMFSLYM